jgi:cation diffusion facilitator family transporter
MSTSLSDAAAHSREKRQSRRLWMVISIATVFALVEFIGSKLAQSSALRADALHLSMDVVALGLSLVALRVSARPAKGNYTFGFRRAEPLAALANAILILIAVFEIVREGIEVLQGDATPQPSYMVGFATLALFANGFSAWLLHGAMHDHGGHSHAGHDHGSHAHGSHAHDHGGQSHGEHSDSGHTHTHDDHYGAEHAEGGHEHAHEHRVSAAQAKTGDRHGNDAAQEASEQAERRRARELNLRGALLHLVGDALGAVFALLAALVIRFGGPRAIDPIAGFFVAAILLIGALRLARDALRVLSEAAPRHLAPEKIRAVLDTHPSVSTVAAVRAWTLGGGEDAVVAHVVSRAADPMLANRLQELIKRRFAAAFVAVHVDPPGCDGDV